MSSTIPTEYQHGPFFSRVRERFHIYGSREESDGTVLQIKCNGCGKELCYDWLKKPHYQNWKEFGKLLKQRLFTVRTHRKCKSQIVQSTSASTSVTNNNITNNNITNIQQNIVIVNLPAVTRKGSTDIPLMCNDIPLPDGKTVQALLDNPETAVSEFVIQRYFTADEPSITKPDPTNTRVKVVHRDRSGNHWVDRQLDKTVEDIVYNTLDCLDDQFDAMSNSNFKDWKRREGLTSSYGFDKTDAYEQMQVNVADVLKCHGAPYSVECKS